MTPTQAAMLQNTRQCSSETWQSQTPTLFKNYHLHSPRVSPRRGYNRKVLGHVH